jgi:hypothetical protein
MRVHPRSSLEEIAYGPFYEVEFSDAVKIGVVVIAFTRPRGKVTQLCL